MFGPKKQLFIKFGFFYEKKYKSFEAFKNLNEKHT